MKNSVVIIMSVYKNDKLEYLKECIDSLYAQSFREFDIFIQLDGKVPELIEKYLDDEVAQNRIKLLNKRDENKGLAYSLNELLHLAIEQGYEYFVRMDADDISMPQRLQHQYEYMQKNHEIDVCGGEIEEFNMDSGAVQRIIYPKTHQEIFKAMKKRNSMAHVTTFFRRSFFLKAGFYDGTRKNEDYELWIRGFKRVCKFHNLQEVLVRVRTNDAFFGRRKDFARAYEVMLLKFDATKSFDFGLKGYVYAVAHFVLFMSPAWLKKLLYKYLRG